MTSAEFEKALSANCLSKKQFASKIGLNYNSVVNWNARGYTPEWVESWLENYKKACELETILGILESYRK